MTPEQKDIVKRTWTSVVPMADTAADLFYDKLFALDPGLKPLFVGVDLAAQKKKLVQALAATIAGLDTIEQLVPSLQDLGRRHAGYGVVDAHYETVGRALLWTLQQGLKERWTSETEAAWTAAYGVVAQTMMDAARKAAVDRTRWRFAAA